MMFNDLRFIRFWFVLGCVFVAAAMVLSLMPLQQVTMPSWNDKFEHTMGYFLLSLWFCGLYRRQRYWVVALWMFAMGVLVEMLQGMMHLGRQADIKDIYADILGIGIAIILAMTPLGRWSYWFEKLVPKA